MVPSHAFRHNMKGTNVSTPDASGTCRYVPRPFPDQVTCKSIHPEIITVPVGLALAIYGDLNPVAVYVAAKLVAMRMRRFHAGEATLAAIAKHLNVSERTVKRSIDALKDIGFVTQHERWMFVPYGGPGETTHFYIDGKPEIDDPDGELVRMKDMYIFHEVSQDGEEL